MSKTVVGLFNTIAEANHIKQHLTTEGYDASHITVVANNTGAPEHDSETYGVGHKVGEFFSKLTSGDDHAHEHYAKGVNEGGALIAVTVEDDEAAEVAELLKEHGARDIDGNKQAADAGTPVYGGSETLAATSGSTTIPVVEEELLVGKREVERGGVRVYSHLVSRPVEADVTLRDEFINVERRFVDRPATAADFAAGQGESFELNATGEEAVVGKTSRVVEEVVVGKTASEHTQAIHDSVRHTEVDVEEFVAPTTTKTNY